MLSGTLKELLSPAERFEFSTEIASAMIDDAGVAVLRYKNLNRASIGILDFRLTIRQAIRCEQSLK